MFNGFFHIIINIELYSCFQFISTPAGILPYAAQNNDGYMGILSPSRIFQLFAHSKTIQPGHKEIKNHQIRFFLFKLIQAINPISGSDYLIAMGLKDKADSF